jgi:ABC-type transporter Mla MlaB component
MLRITVVDGPNEERWVLQGQLTGEFATELSANWRSSLKRCTARLRIVDLSEVTWIDRDGEEVLLHMLHQGARCVATGVYTRHLLEELQARTKRKGDD